MQGMTRGKGEGSIYKDARGLWTAVIELPPRDGKRRRKVVRSKDKRTALAALTMARQELAARGDLQTSSITAAQWLEHWLAQAATKVRPNTHDGYRAVIHHQVLPVLGTTLKLDKVAPMHIRAVHQSVIENGRSSTYANTAHRVLHTAFAAAVREGLITDNPVARTDAPRRSTRPQEALTVDEAMRLLENLPRDPHGPLWATMLLTGMRRGEALGMQRDRVSEVLDLSWQLQHLTFKHGCNGCGRKRAGDCPERKVQAPVDHEMQHVRGNMFLTRPKSAAGWRIVPLVEPLHSIVHWQMQRQPSNQANLVFARPDGTAFDPNAITRAWPEALRSAGINKHVVLHGLRHTAVDLLLIAGVHEDVVQEIVGHSTRAMTRAYKTRGNRERLTTAMRQMSELVSKPDGAARATLS